MLKNPMLFEEFFRHFYYYKRENMTRWCIDNKDKWSVSRDNVDNVLLENILRSCKMNMSLYINDIKKLLESQECNFALVKQGFHVLCNNSQNNDVFDLLIPFVNPSVFNLKDIIQYGNRHKFDKLIDHPNLEFSTHEMFTRYYSEMVEKLITGNLYTIENLEKLLDKLDSVPDLVIFNRHSINYINDHPEMEWVKSHPKWSLKGLEKHSVRDFIRNAMERCSDSQIKEILEMGIEMIKDIKEDSDDDSYVNLENLMYKYN
jgi:hypothetical protein